MNPDEIITLKFRDRDQLWRKDTLEQIPYFATIFKDEWAKNRKEFIMEEDPIIFLKMIKRYTKTARLSSITNMADYFGINTDELLSKKSDEHMFLNGYREFSKNFNIINENYILVNVENAGKILEINYNYPYKITSSICIKFDEKSDEFIRIDKKISKYVIGEINKHSKFWISVIITNGRLERYPFTIFIDFQSYNSS